MLSASATTKVAVGTGRVRPSERPRAVAHTASRTPDRTSTNQDTAMANRRSPPSGSLVRSPPVRGRSDLIRLRVVVAPCQRGGHDLLRLAHDRRLSQRLRALGVVEVPARL